MERASLAFPRLGLGAIVCVPVRDEARRLRRCLEALARSIAAFGEPCGIVLIVNNTTDRSAEVACAWAKHAGIPFLCCEVRFAEPVADVGHARRFALDVAAELARVDAVLLTTDGDTCVTDGWVRAMVRAVRGGASLAYGPVGGFAHEYAALPEPVRALDRTERALFEVQSALWSIINPGVSTAIGARVAGANMAVSAIAYRRVGRLPALASGEDRALAALMLRGDEPVAFVPDAPVVTSCRLAGRAAGGMADALAGRAAGTLRCDRDLLPTRDFMARALLWRYLHAPQRGSCGAHVVAMAQLLAIEHGEMAALAGERTGERWARLMALARITQPLDHATARRELGSAQHLCVALRTAADERTVFAAVGRLPRRDA